MVSGDFTSILKILKFIIYSFIAAGLFSTKDQIYKAATNIDIYKHNFDGRR